MKKVFLKLKNFIEGESFSKNIQRVVAVILCTVFISLVIFGICKVVHHIFREPIDTVYTYEMTTPPPEPDPIPVINVTHITVAPTPDPTEPYKEAGKYIAKTIYGEARGCSITEQAAVAWCILNRVDQRETQTPKDVIKVVTAPGQFHGYVRSNPCTDEHYELAMDVIERWLREKEGEVDVGRVLPKEYIYFAGRNGHNWFRKAYKSRNYWDWSLPSPYEEAE